MILAKDTYRKALDSGVCPRIQGGPLMHIIAAKAVAFGEALQPSFKTYAKAVVDNAKALADALLQFLGGLGVRLLGLLLSGHALLVYLGSGGQLLLELGDGRELGDDRGHQAGRLDVAIPAARVRGGDDAPGTGGGDWLADPAPVVDDVAPVGGLGKARQVLGAGPRAWLLLALPLAFQIRLMDFLGIAPELTGCVACGETELSGAGSLSARRGGLLCRRCRAAEGGAGWGMGRRGPPSLDGEV